MDEKKYTEVYNFQIKEGWDGEGYLVLTQGGRFNNFQSNKFEQGILLDGIAILFNKDYEIDKDTIEIIKILIRKFKKKKSKIAHNKDCLKKSKIGVQDGSRNI